MLCSAIVILINPAEKNDKSEIKGREKCEEVIEAMKGLLSE